MPSSTPDDVLAPRWRRSAVSGSPAGGCVWHVVGLQCSIRERSMRQGWGGKPIGEKQAHGILVAALGMLAAFYGHVASAKPRA